MLRITTSPLRLLALALFLLVGCIAVQGESTGVSLTAEGLTLEVSWLPTHAWADELESDGMRFHLYAEYRSGGRLVEEDLGVPALMTPRSMQFRLPVALKSIPDSAVCMSLRRSALQPAIPIRLSGSAGSDVGQFRYAEWDARLRDGLSPHLMDLKAGKRVLNDAACAVK